MMSIWTILMQVFPVLALAACIALLPLLGERPTT